MRLLYDRPSETIAIVTKGGHTCNLCNRSNFKFTTCKVEHLDILDTCSFSFFFSLIKIEVEDEETEFY